MNLWRVEFDEKRFNDEDEHHFSWGAMYKVDFPTDQQVEAAARAIVQKWSGLKEGDTPEARANRVTLDPYWTDIARSALEAAYE